jgi:transcriptional regulator with XRE-family HTH domain
MTLNPMHPLERRRKAAGLTIIQIAKRLGVQKQTISQWENGKTQPSPEMYPKLAAIFGITSLEVTELVSPSRSSADTNQEGIRQAGTNAVASTSAV